MTPREHASNPKPHPVDPWATYRAARAATDAAFAALVAVR